MRTARLLLARRRRPLAVVLVLAALWITVRSAAPTPPATLPVLVAARDLPAGPLTSDDLRRGAWPADQIPSGRLADATGRTLASPIRSGELLTDARVVGAGLLAGQAPDTVAVPIRLGDPAAGALVRPGDRVDVLVSSSAAMSNWSAETWPSEPDPAAVTPDPDPADGTHEDTVTPTPANRPAVTERANPSNSVTPTGDTTNDGATPTDSANQSGASLPAVRDDSREAERVATRALVLAAPGGASAESGWPGSSGTGLSGLTGGALPGPTSGDAASAGLLVLAVDATEARRLAAVQSSQYLGIVVLPRP